MSTTFFFSRMNFDNFSRVQARCDSSNIAILSIGGRRSAVSDSSRNRWMIWIKLSVSLRIKLLVFLFSSSDCALYLSIASASRKTFTSGSLPERNIACSSLSASKSWREFAILRPTSVLPAPGTPVTKQMDLFRSARLSSMMRSMHEVVAMISLSSLSRCEIS